MRARRRRRFYAAAIGALLFVVVAATTAGGAADSTIIFGQETNTFVLAGGSSSSIALNFLPAQAAFPQKFVVLVPAGYHLDLTAAPGSEIAFGGVSINSVDLSSTAAAAGPFVAEDPAAFASDPVAQACAPGVHAAVWTLSLAIAGQPVTVRIFIDPGGSDGAAYTLRSCPSGLAAGTSSSSATITIAGIAGLAAPSADGDFVWRALVYPQSGPSYELQALVPQPERVTLTGRYDRGRRQAVLTGRVVEGGKAASGAGLTLVSLQGGAVHQTKANASGSFRFRVRVKRSTDFEVSVASSAGPCAASSPAAGGCVGSMTVPPDDAFATVWVSVPGGAARAIRVRDQRQAERENLALGDFPSDFGTVEATGADSCMSGRGERHVTITGESASLAFVRPGQGDATSDFEAVGLARVYASAKQARAAFRREARLSTVRCELGDLASGASRLSPFRLTGVAGNVRAFRAVVRAGIVLRGDLDLVFLQRGRSVALLRFVRINAPIDVEAAAVARVAARLR